jgi:hypothetical protein
LNSHLSNAPLMGNIILVKKISSRRYQIDQMLLMTTRFLGNQKILQNQGIYFSNILQFNLIHNSIIHRNRSDSSIKSSKMGYIAFIVFISVVITVGVLTVCFTSPKPSMFHFEIDFQFRMHQEILT